MRALLRLGGLAAVAIAGLASAQSLALFDYSAQTSAPTARTGAVQAGMLTWTCAGSECHIRGPWPAPGVAACAQLAAQVGRITSYGRAGAMLNAAQLAQCNANLPMVQTQLDPNAVRRIQRPSQLPLPLPQHSPIALPIAGPPADYVASMSSAVSGRATGVPTPALPWNCNGTHCSVHAPHAIADIVAECRALRAAVRAATTRSINIVAIDSVDTSLTADQLGACNADETTTAAPPRSASDDTRVALEEWGVGDITEHVQIVSGISFHGVTAPRPAPELPPPLTGIVEGRIVTEGLSLRASAPGATPTVGPGVVPLRPSYMYATGAVTLRIPVQFDDMPGSTDNLALECWLFNTRYIPDVPAPHSGVYSGVSTISDPRYTAINAPGAHASRAVVADGRVNVYIRNNAHYVIVLDIPMQLRPFFTLADAHGYACDVYLRTAGGGGITGLMDLASDPAHPEFNPAAGSSPRLTVQGNIR